MPERRASNLLDERGEMMAEATRWLLEMELLNNPHMKNALILNIYKVSRYIQDVELLIDENQKRMLIYLALSPFGRFFKKREISQSVLDMLQGVLPSFQFRATYDPDLFLKAVKGLQAHLAKRAAALQETKAKAESKPPAEKPSPGEGG